MAADLPRNRLGLAKWLVDPRHPLVARVTVNRFWQMLFGTGLVATSDDFGTRGEWPSHPELLDWLAVDFVESGWDVKRLLKMMVMSSTYRQTGRTTDELLRRDPDNRLLARGPRLRLDAEMIRDSALFAGGLLRERVGGPSVFPYQPDGLWKEISFNPREFTAQIYVPGVGADVYRRSMYTFWKRAVPPPAYAIFDAPDRETCTVRRARSNTPFQALVIMNDITFVEAARGIAERVMTEAPTETDERIAYAFRLLTSRRPSQREIAIVRSKYQAQLADYRANPDEALRLLTAGDLQRNRQLDPSELAGWTFISSMIMNLSEALTR